MFFKKNTQPRFLVRKFGMQFAIKKTCFKESVFLRYLMVHEVSCVWLIMVV